MDKRFLELMNGLDDLEYSAAILDYLIKDFFQFMKKNNFLDSTTIIFLPAHLYMVKPSIFHSINERQLFYLSNSEIELDDLDDNSIYQVHMPKIILSSCGIDHNIKFFSDYFTTINDSLILEKQSQITSLNISGFKTATSDYNLEMKKVQINDFDSDLLVAHAAGEIDGFVYTNSLEALNNSYREGFKLFELDINKTSDDHYVAVHDWEEWANIVQYNNKLPPDYNSFMTKRLYDKFTPVDINTINYWFGEHKDAILVTDKVNEPYLFSKSFKYNDRLIMELFSLDSISTAKTLKIKVLLSENVIKELNFDKRKFLELNIKGIAVSNSFVLENQRFVQELSKSGITPFIYGINDYFIGGNVINNENYFRTKNPYGFNFGLYSDRYLQ